ncbi:MAG: hypothetical protein GTN99_09215 [Candidatus Dadabacteria bacterium]|nr:hypothetical protein [Candidatus Dadabacteria bacterium]
MKRTHSELTVDEELYNSSSQVRTGIYVSAMVQSTNKRESVDISLLDKESMNKWLHTKSREYLEELVRYFSGHEVSRD